jgi:hypothetical protein
LKCPFSHCYFRSTEMYRHCLLSHDMNLVCRLPGCEETISRFTRWGAFEHLRLHHGIRLNDPYNVYAEVDAASRGDMIILPRTLWAVSTVQI